MTLITYLILIIAFLFILLCWAGYKYIELYAALDGGLSRCQRHLQEAEYRSMQNQARLLAVILFHHHPQHFIDFIRKANSESKRLSALPAEDQHKTLEEIVQRFPHMEDFDYFTGFYGPIECLTDLFSGSGEEDSPEEWIKDIERHLWLIFKFDRLHSKIEDYWPAPSAYFDEFLIDELSKIAKPYSHSQSDVKQKFF